MTNEQIKEDMLKFVRYLQANDTKVVSLVIETAEGTVAYGPISTIMNALIRILADRQGYKMEAR